MRGLEVPAEVVATLNAGKRPRVRITINHHTWSTRVSIMRGRHLVGLSHANRLAAGVEIGEHIKVELELDEEPLIATEPEDLAYALTADPAARARYDRLTLSQRRQHIRKIESAKRTEARMRRIQKLLDELRHTSK